MTRRASTSQNGVRGSSHMIENGMANIRPPLHVPPDQMSPSEKWNWKVFEPGYTWILLCSSSSPTRGDASLGFAM